MNATTAVFLREVRARRDSLWLAFAFAGLGFSVPFLPGVQGISHGELWQMAAAVLALVMAIFLAVIFGVSVFGSDLSEHRSGFFFARPLSTTAIWFGRITGIYVLILACELIVLIPGFFGLVSGGMVWHDSIRFWPAILVLPAALILISHTLSIMFRARTAWTIFDIVSAMVAGTIGWVAIDRLVLIEAPTALRVALSVTVATVLAALTLAGFVGTRVGRADLRRSHRALSITLACSLLTASGVMFYWAKWMVTFAPDDLEQVYLSETTSDGGVVSVWGPGRGRFDVDRGFLVATEDDRWVTLPDRVDRLSPEFSEDGNRAVWLVRDRHFNQKILWWADLSGSSFELSETTLGFEGYTKLFLSEDGRFLATYNAENVSMYDLEAEKLLWMANEPHSYWIFFPKFTETNEFRVSWWDHSGEKPIRTVRAYDVETGDLQAWEDQPEYQPPPWSMFTASGEATPRHRECSEPTCTVRFRSPRPGGFPSEVSLPKWADSASTLQDLRLVAFDSASGPVRKIALETNDHGWTVHEFSADPEVLFGDEAVPGSLILFERQPMDPEERAEGSYFLFDLKNGTKTHIVDGPDDRDQISHRAYGYWRSTTWSNDDPNAFYFFIDSRGALVRWDPETNELTTIAGGVG